LPEVPGGKERQKIGVEKSGKLIRLAVEPEAESARLKAEGYARK
jgi:hypothetical protein